ncbi:MAG TPA: AzlD domain-containing protein [Rhodothermales bacterium]|nr:AzlD domain-containing protein [Rhodothermales bacterium]
MRTLLALLGMALGTYALRAGGFWLIARFAPSPFVERALGHTPGAVIVALVAPALLAGGWPDLAAAAITATVALRTRSLLAAIGAGTLAVCLFRFLLT